MSLLPGAPLLRSHSHCFPREAGRVGIKTWTLGTSLAAQWLRIHLPKPGTWVRSLVQEDYPTCAGQLSPCPTTTEPVHRNEEEALLAATGESLRAAARPQRSQKQNSGKNRLWLRAAWIPCSTAPYLPMSFRPSPVDGAGTAPAPGAS